MEGLTDVDKKSDLELLALAKEDAQCFGALMERYEKPLFNYIQRVSSLPREDTEDLLQEIFIKIYKQLNQYPNIIKFSSWIYRITHNQLVDYFRRANTRPRTNNFEQKEWAKIVKENFDIEKEIINKECYKKISETINELPLKYKEVLVLRFLEDFDYEEIMDILKKPKGSVATLISRGKKILKRELKRKGIDCL